ncbi:NAD-dependent epimerase/dehydratase [Candidatus Nanopelagicaceae bacterium]
MNVLVTGASGQLGQRIVSYLLSNGIHVSTLGRNKISDKIANHPWSLGMSPNPQSFKDIDFILHLAWSTKDRGDLDFHLNVGGSAKIMEASRLSGIKMINISSLATINPISHYGKAKKIVEELNLDGINLRIAKIEDSTLSRSENLIKRSVRKIIFLPIPRDLSVQVIEIDNALNEIIKFIEGNHAPGIYELPFNTCTLRAYLKNYHGLKSFAAPTFLLKVFFYGCQSSRTRIGKVAYDRWVSLISTHQALSN